MFTNITGFAGAIDTVFGKTRVRTTQLGFPAELTSTYDATTGYDWKRLQLDLAVPEFNDPTIQPEGSYAFEVTDDQSLAIGTRVWLEPDPDCAGYDFHAAGATITGTQVASGPGTIFNITLDATWQNITGMSVVLPGAGTYLLWGRAGAQGNVGGGAVTNPYVRIRLDDGTATLALSDTTILSAVTSAYAGIGGGATMFLYTTVVSPTITLQAFRSTVLGGVGWTACQITDSVSMGYIKIS